MVKSLIYIVDDDSEIVELYSQILGREPNLFESKVFTEVEKLLEEIEKGQIPDIFIIDIMMPNITGIELISILHKKQIKRPVIVVSGVAQKEHAISALNHGAFAMLEKPITSSTLLSVAKQARNYFRAFAMAEKLMQLQTKLIENMDIIKANYESRLVKAEDFLIEATGSIVIGSEPIDQYFKKIREDRMVNDIIDKSKAELEELRKDFKFMDAWH